MLKLPNPKSVIGEGLSEDQQQLFGRACVETASKGIAVGSPLFVEEINKILSVQNPRMEFTVDEANHEYRVEVFEPVTIH